MKKKTTLLSIIAIFYLIVLIIFRLEFYKKFFNLKNKTKEKNIPCKITPTIIPVISPATVATPSAKPMSFEEQNKLYGPCVKLDVLMYHHIQELRLVKSKGDKNLTVDTEIFKKQMEYLKEKKYSVIGMTDLKNFFDKNIPLPIKPVLITADDAYEDNYLDMFPILKEFGFKATIFVPTGLINNPGYLKWNQIEEMKNSGLIYLANHTWSHHNSGGTIDLQDKEIGTANSQLIERGLNSDKIFAYPYGKSSVNSQKSLKELDYQIAFTTNHGNVICKKQSLELPRIRVGNSQLNNYGL